MNTSTFASFYIFYLLLSARGATGSAVVEQVEGVVGGDLTLPCDVMTPIDDRVAVILWYRDSHPDAMYTYDARNTSLGYRQHTPRDQSMARRTRFDPIPPARLVIKEATLLDAGKYECRVDFMRAPSKTTIIEVTVVEPPSAIQISLHDSRSVTYTVTANEGSPLRLSCIVTGGKPRPRVWWTLKNKTHDLVLDETYEALTSDLTQNALMLPKLTSDFHQAKISCHAAISNSSSISSFLTLLLNMAPQQVRITGLTSPLEAGKRYRVGCETKGSRPAPILSWIIKRPDRLEEILATQDLSKRNVSRSWLELKVDWIDHGATLKCSAASPALPDHTVTNSSVFDVQFSPRLHLALGRMLQPGGIREGIDVYFHCSVTANPRVYKISWFHNDEEVHQNSAEGVLVSDDHLVLQKIKRRWSGSYKCKASNVVGDSVSNILSVIVQYAPICASSTSTAVYRASLGQEIVLPCRVLSHPRNVSFSWTFMNTLTEHERVPGDRVSWQGLESRLRYLPEKAQDYGTLHCWASNWVGHQKKPCVFAVKPAGVPSPPVNCSVNNQTWESMGVTCGSPGMLGQQYREQGFLTGGVQFEDLSKPGELVQDHDKPRFLMTVRDRSTHGVVHNVTGERGMFSVTGLTPGLDYIITVLRYNSHGRSQNITLEAFTLRTAENRMREEEEDTDSALLGVILGVMGVLFLLAVGAIIITLKSRVRARPSTPIETTRLPPREANESTGLDHPDLLELDHHSSPLGPYRSAEVTQALLSAPRPLDEEVSLPPPGVTPTAHLEYLPCEGVQPITPTLRPHTRHYVRAEGHNSQEESFL